MTEVEKEFIINLIKFVNTAAGEGIGLTISNGETVWAEDLMYEYWGIFNNKWPDWVPEEIRNEWGE